MSSRSRSRFRHECLKNGQSPWIGTDRQLFARFGAPTELYGAGGKRGEEPLWRRHYPLFPRVHCVLGERSRAVLERRRSTALALLRSNPLLWRAAKVSISICLLEDLEAEGPFAPIFRDVRDPGRAVDWLGRTSTDGEKRG